jgi:hypothetical protein
LELAKNRFHWLSLVLAVLNLWGLLCVRYYYRDGGGAKSFGPINNHLGIYMKFHQIYSILTSYEMAFEEISVFKLPV